MYASNRLFDPKAGIEKFAWTEGPQRSTTSRYVQFPLNELKRKLLIIFLAPKTRIVKPIALPLRRHQTTIERLLLCPSLLSSICLTQLQLPHPLTQMIMTALPKDDQFMGVSSPEPNKITSMPRGTAGSSKMMLPKDFVPGQNSVVCGRGKVCSSAPGNRRLKSILDSYLKPYSQAKSKLEKSSIVSTIVNMIKQSAPTGAFVKFEKGHWYAVEDSVAREKIGCMFRDALHTQYRSSTKAKLARRRACKEAEMFQNMNPSDAMWFTGNSQNYSNSLMGTGALNNLSDHGTSTRLGGESGSMDFASDIYNFTSQQEEKVSSQMSIKSLKDMDSSTTSTSLDLISQIGQHQQLQQRQAGQQAPEQRASRGLSMARSNMLRNLLPMSSHLEIMGMSPTDKISSTGSGSGSGSSIESILEQGFDILSSPPSSRAVAASVVLDTTGNSSNANFTANKKANMRMVLPPYIAPDGADDLPDDISGIFDDEI